MWYCKISKKTEQLYRRKGFFIAAFMVFVGTTVFAKGQMDTNLAKDYFEIAQAYAEVGKYDKAVTFFLKAAADPAHKNAVEYNLARVYGLQGDWQRARPLLERQYKEAPSNLLIQNAFAYSLAATGAEERACELYKKIYLDDTENPESALNYARILILTKKYDEATAFINDIKKRFTENAEKKTLDELEEKIKKALSPPDKAADNDDETDKADDDETEGHTDETADGKKTEEHTVKSKKADTAAQNTAGAEEYLKERKTENKKTEKEKST